jgi:hypothetical protein
MIYQHYSRFLLFLAIVITTFGGCLKKADYDGFYNVCNNDSTGIFIQLRDPTTNEPLPGRKFILEFDRPALFFPINDAFVDTLVTDNMGAASYRFTAEPNDLYSLHFLPDSAYTVAGSWNIPLGCDHTITPILKQSVPVTLIIENTTISDLSSVSAVISGGNSTRISDPGIFFPEPVNFFEQYDIEPIPINTSQSFNTPLPGNTNLTITIAFKSDISPFTQTFKQKFQVNQSTTGQTQRIKI